MNQTAYLDLKDIFVNEIFGDIWLFAILGMVIIWIFGLKAKVPMQGMLLLNVLWVGLCLSASLAEMYILWIMVLMLVGFIFYYMIMRVLER